MTAIPQPRQPYPFDYDALERGTFYSEQWIGENLFGPDGRPLTRGIYGERYGIELMVLRSLIERETEARGNPMMTRQDNYGIRIMTDAEAVDYISAYMEGLLRKLRFAHGRLMRVRESELSPEERQRKEDAVTKNSWRLQALAEADKKHIEAQRLRLLAANNSEEDATNSGGA